MEQVPDLLISERSLIQADQEKRAIIILQQGFSHGEIVFDLGHDILGGWG